MITQKWKVLPENWDDLSPDQRKEFWKAYHVKVMEVGTKFGWWEEWDGVGPIEVIRINEGDFPSQAELAVHLKLFPSLSQARKNGWLDPLVKGTIIWKNKKRTKIVVS